MDIKEILKHVDHTLLLQGSTWEEIKQICDDAMKYETASVCIAPSYVKEAAEYMNGRIPVCTVIGFPNGYMTTAAKEFETKDALANGASEIDMVINIGWLKDKKYDLIENEIKILKAACGDKILKVIIETCFLTDEEKIKMCEIVTNAGADYIKTSTGFGGTGATFADIELFAKVAHAHGVPLVVDNTFPTPVNCRPFEWGADIVTHSTTKYMDGTASQVGGVVVDSGNFDWMANAEKFPGLCTPDESYHGLTYVKAFGKMGYTTKLVAQLMRDLGSIPAPMNSFILNLGLQSLHLRMRQHCENAQKVAEFLQNDERVAWVHYSGLKGDEYYDLAQKYMPNGTCGVIAFGLKGDRETAIKFMDSLDMINIVTHVADARTCVLHPASHTHRQLSDEQLKEAGVAPDLIRLSVGIEDVEDILDDIKQALDKI